MEDPSYETYLKRLLEPLGIYDFTKGGAGESILYAAGKELDETADQIGNAERESQLMTAEGEGLSRREDLFAWKPAAPDTAHRRAAIAALLRINDDSLTLNAINDTIDGCGIKARAQERANGHIRIIFPDTVGIPEKIEQIKKIILDIIPCHLETEFYFRFLTWTECETRNMTWKYVENANHTWETFETDVLPVS